MRVSSIFAKAIIFLVISFQSSFGIYNGKTATPHSHPWILNFHYAPISPPERWTPRDHHCGASLIRVPYLNDSSDIAITAAHCAKTCDFGKTAYAIASDHDLDRYDRGETEVEISAFIHHPNYSPSNSTLSFDIAVLKLAQPLNFSDTIRPIELARKDEPIPHDVTCFTAGWGAITYELDPDGVIIPTSSARLLQEIPITWMLDDADCRANMQLCNLAPLGHHSGPGDSGSPMVCDLYGRYVLYGIVSGGGLYGVIWKGANMTRNMYTNVGEFTDWIEAIVESEESNEWVSFRVNIFPMVLLVSVFLLVYTVFLLDMVSEYTSTDWDIFS